MRQENHTRFARVEATIEGNTHALEAMQTRIDARIDALENSKSSSSSGCRKRNEHNSVRVVAIGFTESSNEEEVRELLQGMIKKHAMEESLEDTHCPAKPITHAFLQFNTGMDRNGFLRLTSRQQHTIEQWTIRFRPDLNPEVRYLQKQLRFAKYYLNTTCEIPLNKIRIDSKQKQISVQVMITTKPDGTLTFHKHEAIREQIDEKMDQWTTKN